PPHCVQTLFQEGTS
ncbi:hypothetical protein D018_1752B, partial [Vibrio parahaemolyticus VP2007-007]